MDDFAFPSVLSPGGTVMISVHEATTIFFFNSLVGLMGTVFRARCLEYHTSSGSLRSWGARGGVPFLHSSGSS